MSDTLPPRLAVDRPGSESPAAVGANGHAMLPPDAIPCPIATTDADGRLLELNAALLDIVGGDRAQWRERPIDALMPEACRELLRTQAWPLLRQGETVRELNLQLRRAGGQSMPVLLNAAFHSTPGPGVAPRIVWVLFVAARRADDDTQPPEASQRAETALAALQRRERFLHTITDAMPGLVAYWDADLVCRFANSRHADWYPGAPAKPAGLRMHEVLGPEATGRKRPYVDAVLGGEPQRFELRHDTADGCRFALTHYIPDRDPGGRVAGFFVLSVDVTRLKLAEQDLRLAHGIVRSASEAIMVSDPRGIIVSVNPAFTETTGFTAEEAVGSHEAIVQIGAHAERLIGAEGAGVWRGEAWATRKDGSRFLAFRAISSMPGCDDAPARFVTIFTDVTERWRRDERVRHLALHDPLTELPNRTLLLERLGRLIEISRREPRSLALMFMDLDGFKAVNDALGHAAGDELLRAVARSTLEQVRSADTLARFGGDEFVLLIDNPRDRAEVAGVAQRIIAAVNRPRTIAGVTVRVGTSIGIARLPGTASDAAELLAEADLALYAVKAAGKNHFKFHGEAPV